MKALLAVVLVALFALVASAPAEESDIAFLPFVASWAIKKLQKKKDAVQSDAEIKKFLSKVGGIVKKGVKAYQTVKGLGIFEDEEADKINWEKIKKYATPENLQKAVDIWKILKKKRESELSDAEFLRKVKKWWDEKGKNLFNKGKELFNKGKQIYAILKNRSAPAEESDIAFLPFVASWALKKLQKKKDAVQSDAEIKKFLSKVGGIVKKGVKAYQTVKGLGIFDDEESDQAFQGVFVQKIKDRIKEKLSKQLQEDGTAKRVCTLTRLRTKPFCASRANVEADKIQWGKLVNSKNLQKVVGLYKAIKGDVSESDAEFLRRLKKWWDEKGQNLFNKGKELFNKGKQIYAVLKNKPEAETEADAEFFNKVKQWWENKGKDMYNKGRQIYEIVKKN